MKEWVNFDQTCIETPLGHGEEMNRFWWPWPNFSKSPHYKDRKNEHCLHYVSWTNWWILTKFAQKLHQDMGKKWLDFGEPDLIFKATPSLWMSNFDQKSLSAPYLFNQMMDSGQTLCIVSSG